MIENRNVSIITDMEGKTIVQINEIRFKGKRNIDWDGVKDYLKGFVRDQYTVDETGDTIYIGNQFTKEFPESKSRTALKGAAAKAKANSAMAIPELIKTAENPIWEKNTKIKHDKDAKYGWYRYNVRFSIPVFNGNLLAGYNVYTGQLLINYASNGKKYLYDILGIKKETSNPQQ